MLKIDYSSDTPEILIYFYIQTLGDFLYFQHRLKRRGEIDVNCGIEEEEAAYDQQVKLVEVLKTKEGFNFANHDEYLQWYRWWNNWHKNELSDEEWRKLDRFLAVGKTEEDFAKWRPSGSWRKDKITTI